MKISKRLISCFILFVVIANSASAQYRDVDFHRVSTVKLTPEQLTWLKDFLSHQTGGEMRDSIFIWYGFNRNDCWFLMDEKESDEKIKRRIHNYNNYLDKLRASRPSASIIHIREPGNDFNKITQFDTTMVIDSSKQLGDLLFKKKKSACGTSAIILPDGRVILTRDESHFFALYYTKEQVEKILKKKK